MNRAERRQLVRKNKSLKDMPKFVLQHQQNMAAVLVTSALTVLAEDFQFTPEQLTTFNDKMQKKAMELVNSPERG